MIVDRATLERVGLKNALHAVEWAGGCGYSANKALAELAGLATTLERVERAWETIKRALDDLDAEQRAAYSRCDNGVRATVVLNALRGLLAEGEESREP